MKTFYWEKNPQSRETIVFLHGFPGNHLGLVDLANKFPNQYRLIIPDMPACGKTPPLSRPHTLKNYARWLKDFLRELQIENPIIVGHSFGSRVALVFASHYQNQAEKLVLLTPVVALYGIMPRIASLKGIIAKMLPQYMQKRWLSHPLYQYVVKMIIFKSASKKRRDEITNINNEELKSLDVNATIEVFDEFYTSNLLPMAKAIKIPCLIIAGDRVEVDTPASIKKLGSQSNLFTVAVMQKSGHLLPLESPAATAKIIKHWLNNTL